MQRVLMLVFGVLAFLNTGALLASGPNTDFPKELTIKVAHHDMKTGKLLYEGIRKQVTENEKVSVVSTYTDMDGKLLDRSQVAYERPSLRVLSYKSEDIRFGALEELTLTGNTLRISFREDKTASMATEDIKWGPETVHSSTVTEVINRDWAQLSAGENVEFDLVVPSRLETLRFRLKKDKTTQVGGKSVLVVRMEPDSWLIRKLVDPMYFFLSYDMPHRLLEYHGRSGIKTSEGKDQDLRLVFTYE